MRNLLTGGLVLLALATAGAANARPAGASYGWSGCYVGVNGGYGWNSGNSSYRDANSIGDPINFLPAPVILFMGIPFAPPPLSYIPTPSGTSGSGGLAGATGGCNSQHAQWVVGFEADIDWANISGTANTSANSGAKQFGIGLGTYSGVTTPGTASEQVSLRWLSTIRARGGVLVSDRLLVFATGGLALGGIDSQGSVDIYSGAFGALSSAWSGSNSVVKVGGTVGGGLEWALWDRTSLKAEYLWYTFGNVSHPLNCSYNNGFPCAGGSEFPTLGSTNSSVYGSIVRIGLNYKFW
jgi:outer membrane immunogenic protein